MSTLGIILCPDRTLDNALLSLPYTSPEMTRYAFLADLLKAGTHRMSLSSHHVEFEAQAAEAKASDSFTLVVTAPGLCAEQLIGLAKRLPLDSEQVAYELALHCELPGQQIVAKLKVGQNVADELKAQLDALSHALQLELMLVGQAPSLTEPGLLVMDMDSTVIKVECIDEIARLAGVGEQVSKVTAMAMRGELAFSESLVNRVACLADAPQSILEEVRQALPLMPGVVNLINVLKQHGWKLAIASGGFTYFADYLKDRLGIDYAVSNVLEIESGKLTGNVHGNIVDAEVKAQTVTQLAEQFDIPKRQVIAMGDGANDLVMMTRAGLGVAAHAKPIVREKADMAIRFGGLDTLLAVLER
ncbi:phosphoserine phosphatase SerB [Aestuariibacter salexigens]|uniref:phosphoserine phosphatase SerB n=1 Tax=Aestuariibacter salexigens TaxID=226010 RepID=UPI001F0ADE4D|nr:phosphoserine phosphatase SerB [Aestuariibacter salexigens]